MQNLTKKDRDNLIKLLQDGKDDVVKERAMKIFELEEAESQKEYELKYKGKSREEDIIADTLAAPLQEVRTFNSDNKFNDDWTNKLMFGDNLLVLKNLYENPIIKGKVKLIYIDPPFAVNKEFLGNKEQKAYQDKIIGAKFVEFTRKRLIFLRELLAEDGSIYVHLDPKKGHYIKIILDEIFGEENFRNEVIWSNESVSGFKSQANKFIRGHDVIFYYSKPGNPIFNKQFLMEFSEATIRRYDKIDKDGRRYKIYYENGKERRRFLEESAGKPIMDVWDRYSIISNS